MDSSGFHNPRCVALEEGDSCSLPALTHNISEKKWPSLGHMEEKGQFPKGMVVLLPEDEQKDARQRKISICEEWRLVTGNLTSLICALLSKVQSPGKPDS